VPWTATPELSDGAGGSRTPAEAVGGAIQFNIGGPPTLGSGREQLVPFAFNFEALPFAAAGRYIVKLMLNGEPVRDVAFTVHVEQTATFRAPAGPGPGR